MVDPKDIIPLEELEEDLKEEQAENNAILTELEELFDETDFERVDDMNHISFQASSGDIKAQFSLDNSEFTFTCYISEVDDNSFNYSRKGTKHQAIDAAEKFLAEYDDWTTNTKATDYSEDELPLDDLPDKNNDE